MSLALPAVLTAAAAIVTFEEEGQNLARSSWSIHDQTMYKQQAKAGTNEKLFLIHTNTSDMGRDFVRF